MPLLLDGKKVAGELERKLVERLEHSPTSQPSFVGVQVGKDNEGSNLYLKFKRRAAHRVGLGCEIYELPSDVPQKELLDLIRKVNGDPSVNGIIVQLPLPPHLNKWEVIRAIDPAKDIDGLTPHNNWALDNNLPGLRPCTPKGILSLLRYYSIPVEGSRVAVVNRSPLVGNPLSKLLRNHHATVVQCHSRTKNKEQRTYDADIAVFATGVPNLVDPEWLGPHSVVIDVSSPQGDCTAHFKAIKEKVKAITPVPGGVGPMTIVSLLENTAEAAQSQKKKS